MRQVRSEAHTPDSPHSVCTDTDATIADVEIDEDHAVDSMLDTVLMSPTSFPEYRKSRCRNNKNQNGDLSKRSSISCRSLERLNRGPGRVSVWSETAQIQIPHPFRGAQSSQMMCTSCGFKVNIFTFSFSFTFLNNFSS